MFPLIVADQWTKTSSSSKGYSDLGASHKTRGAVEYSSEGCNLSSPHPCARHKDESSAASAARKSSFSPRTWSGWIPVTSTGMRDRGCAATTTLICECARWSSCDAMPSPRPRRGKRSVGPRTWSGWIPVTSTGMRGSTRRAVRPKGRTKNAPASRIERNHAATAKRKGHPAPPDGPFSMCCSRYCCTTTRALRPGRTRE
ncbi:hypothetical protein KGO5_00046 [Sinorhizobium sp. KGO-5]|nr:hypothetical protein KGO5_00046 [Sinorhizobium sp. KGO-5]